MAVNAVGQITIIDFNDAIALTGYITSNHSSTVKYNQDDGSYNPNFGTSNAVLTPHVFISGGGTNDIMADLTSVKSVTWKRQTNAMTAPGDLTSNEVSSGLTNSGKLTIKANPFSASIYAVSYLCTVVYTDPVSKLDSSCTIEFSFNAVTQGQGTAYAEITSEKGYTFKNGEPDSITLSANLYRGSVQDNTNLTYQWFKYSGSSWPTTAIGTGQTLTVTPDAVDALALFRVTISDTVNGDSFTSDPCSVTDYTDPLMVTITSTGGNIFKNGSGSSTLTAIVYQNGKELTEGLTYSWSKLNQDGSEDTSWAVKTTKSITIGSADIDTKATFICTVTKA